MHTQLCQIDAVSPLFLQEDEHAIYEVRRLLQDFGHSFTLDATLEGGAFRCHLPRPLQRGLASLRRHREDEAKKEDTANS